METLLAQMPALDGMYFLSLASRFLHIVGAIILVGGIAYLRKVVAPVATGDSTGRAAEGAGGDPAEQLFAGRRKVWAKWVGIATVVLLATGIFNFIQIYRANPDLPGLYHPLFGVKVLSALVLFFLAAILAGKTAAAERFRADAKKWLTISLTVGLLTVALASVLRSLHLPAPADAAAPPAAENEP